MKYLLSALLVLGISSVAFAADKEETKYICSIGGMDDVYTTEFSTKEECEKYCKSGLGRPAICEETGKKTVVRTHIG